MHVLAEADALDLARRLGDDLGLAGAVEAKKRGERADAGAQMRADRDVLEHRHPRHELDVLEGAADARGRRCRAPAGRRCARR